MAARLFGQLGRNLPSLSQARPLVARKSRESHEDCHYWRYRAHRNKAREQAPSERPRGGPASPSTGVNTITGEGLDKALSGAEIVVDVANSPSFEDRAVLKFFETSGRNLLAAEAAAGVRHHVALSVVGVDRLPENGYFRAKLVQESLIKASKISYTILRATQFFEFVGGIVDSSADGQIVRLSPALFQPVASDDVAAALADVTLGVRSTASLNWPDPEPSVSMTSPDNIWRRQRTRARSSPTSMLAISEQNWTIGLSRRARIPGSAPCVSRTGWPGSASDGHDQCPQIDTQDARRIASKTGPARRLAVSSWIATKRT